MTNHWVDLQNCKTILVEGSNVAENHPMAFKWIRKAQENGATIIHVDPRYTRTSAAADVYARIRPGTDTAFQNAMINHIIVNKLYDEDYVVTHTNALFLGDEAFDFKDGAFSGFNAATHSYDTKTWGYQLDAKGKPRVARSLDDPHCVFSRLKTFVSRYTLEMGERITGIPADQIRQIAETMAKNRPGSILYALGMTQHTTGVQGIRSFTILQLLLGNIGKPGGGVNALRGEPNVQGACDMAVLYNYMPGYLNSPTNAEPTIYHYARKNGIADTRYLVNTLKAFFGDAATAENDYAYAWLPKRNAVKDYGTLPMFEDALAGKLKMLWIVGQNPAVTLPNLRLTFDAMAKLETLVVQEIWETETAAFWKRPGVDPKSINTEVILLPAAFFMEKNGTISNSGGMVQWRHAGVKPPGQARPDGEIVDLVFRAVRDLVKDSTAPGLWILFDLVWIAVAAGAFAMAGVIYVFQRKDLYGLGRSAVLMGLLSYSFVTVTLLADLGLPWHFYALALNAPEHSAMFEVSWCVGLYVTILMLEFLPVPFAHFGYRQAAATLRRWNGAYVAGAVTLFIYLMSRNVLYALVTAVIFGTLAWIFRARDQKAEPIMLAIAAVTLSTMHQSSLGSLYLLMPNMLAPQWWSPVMPVSFFLSSIAAGTALVIVMDMWIAKGWRRPLEITRLASVGQITFWSLLAYLVFRLGDMAVRNQFAGAFSGGLGLAFAAEIFLFGALPLVLLGSKSLRQRADVLFIASLLAVVGVAYNRMNVVIFAMTLRGRMPWGAPESYFPSTVEWGISIGLIAATIFLFGLGARLMPVLSKAQPSEAH